MTPTRILKTADRTTAFDGYEIISEPCASREQRGFGTAFGVGVCYGAYSLKLATRGGRHFILVEHGGGCEIHVLRHFADDGASLEALIAMPERIQYGFLFRFYMMASESLDQGRSEERQRWAQAHFENRIRIRRLSGGRRAAFIESEFEQKLRLAKRGSSAAAARIH